MAAPYPIRPISEDEFPSFNEVLEHAFNATGPADAERQHHLAVIEFDRTLAVFDQAQVVGTAAALTLQMTVPGGVAEAAGVAYVSVLPSHRRRGIASSLMRRQLADIRGRGESIAVLYPSEAVIYGRYGYAPAVPELEFTVRRGEGAMTVAAAAAAAARPGTGRALRLRIADPLQVTAELAQVYRSVLPLRPGMVVRDDRGWDFALWDPPHRRSGGGPLRCLVAEDDAGPRGYLLYSALHGRRDGRLPADVLQARELTAADPAACVAIWADLLSRDLVGEVRVPRRPVDDPLPHLLADSWRARPELGEGLWLRLVDLPRALAQRRYACSVDLVIDVTDDLLADNAGRWRLRAAGLEQATCERTSQPADVAMTVAALGTAYLGAGRLTGLADAGLVTELRPGALAQLSAAMHWEPAPWCPSRF